MRAACLKRRLWVSVCRSRIATSKEEKHEARSCRLWTEWDTKARREFKLEVALGSVARGLGCHLRKLETLLMH